MITRQIAQPNKQTFKIKPIKELIDKYNTGIIYEPFPYPFEKDALEELKKLPNNCVNTILLDPPYSQRQLKEVYKNIGGFHYNMNSSYWTFISKECYRILIPGGIVIKFGWNSCKINHTMEIIETMLICHGGMHNDTIITVQKKVNSTFD